MAAISTITFDLMERLASDLRRAGYPITKIDVEERCYGEPDAVECENGRERHFYAPIFRWRLEDGRRFYAKPRVHLNRKRVRQFFGVIDVEFLSEDRVAMLNDMIELMKQSTIPTATPTPEEVK